MSTRQTIREAWKTLVETTSYPVGMGEMPVLGPDDAPKAIVLLFADVVTAQGRKKFHRTTVHIQALADAEIAQPWVAIEDMVAAIKTAV
jgi:hypothetical protein